MNSNRSSKFALLLVALVLASGIAGAVSVSSANPPEDAQAGSTVEATFVVTELYQNPSYEQWALEAETELQNVTWTIQLLNQAGNVIDQNTADGATVTQEVSLANDVAEVRMKVTGTVPEVANYSYDPEHTFLFAELRQVRQGGTRSTIETYRTHHYTEESRRARQAIDAAQAAIEAAGGNQQAQDTLDNAISSYENANFGNAADLAAQAERTASSAQQRQQRNQMLLFGGIAVVLIAVIVGGIYWYLQGRTANKL